ncbi:glycolate oxidase subunit GlcE [Azospirillum sp. TSO22-1]|uniref:glycolate oxidase subunit GlcE n=1 Tax=Azospirillum sp. TSO22-1 TaxID=716789 RepID=UPI000D617048|nr:glycolate oxidase subunit GlcE [Azospirillum sp. TSO22-1]PWC54606.1 2-hydroxy-acid oxidase [Azospirillum sp. TSO22-1]
MTITTFKPDTAAQLADSMQWALSHGEPLEVLGTGTKRRLGRPVQAAYALDLSALSGVVAYEPEELVLTVRTGTPLAEVLPMLAARRQHFAFEPQDLGPLYGLPAGGGTVGGMLAAGLTGPRRIQAGSARDHFLGVEGVSGRGEVYKGGGKVVKNVTGYDMPKLMAGSMGTLTAMTEVTLKVLPAPEDVRTLVLLGKGDAEAVRALTSALQSPHEVSGAAHLPAAVAARSGVVARLGGAATCIRLEGFGPSVAARVAALKDELGADAVLERDDSLALWREIRDVAYFVQPAERLVWKLSVPPSEGARVAAAIREITEADVYFDWGGGLLWVAAEPGDADIRECLDGTGGHATLIRAPDDVRASVPVYHPQPEPLAALAARVKESFDPKRLLNPGRLYAGV